MANFLPRSGAPLVYEIYSSREVEQSFDEPSAQIKFIVLNIPEQTDALTAVNDVAPASYLDLVLNNIKLRPEGNGIWFADCLYARWQTRVPGSLTVQFDVAGQTFKKTHAYAQAYYVPPGKVAKNFFFAIGVDNTGAEIKVNGVDEYAPTFAFTITRVFGLPEHGLTEGYLSTMLACQRCVNSSPVTILVQGITLFFNPGELWFQGGTGQVGSDGHSEIVLRFAGEQNLNDVTIAGIAHVSKRGWDYLEVYYADDVDTTAHGIVPKPYQINVSQTKVYTDLNVLFS